MPNYFLDIYVSKLKEFGACITLRRVSSLYININVDRIFPSIISKKYEGTGRSQLRGELIFLIIIEYKKIMVNYLHDIIILTGIVSNDQF